MEREGWEGFEEEDVVLLSAEAQEDQQGVRPAYVLDFHLKLGHKGARFGGSERERDANSYRGRRARERENV